MAIQQHPVPQDISNYKFRLIGDMTIKQFASLGISIVVSVMIYSSPLPFFFRYPLSFLFLVLGVGMAFVPVQGRTLDVWIVAFIKSIYSPTQYIWKHGQEQTTTNTSANPQANPTTETVSIPNTPVVEITPPAADQATESIQTTTNTSSSLNTQTNAPLVEASPPVAEGNEGDLNTLSPTNISPTTDNQTNAPLVEANPSVVEKKEVDLNTQTNIPLAEANPPVARESEGNLNTQPETINLPIPFTPSTPNTLVGLTLTPDGHILDGVMVEIKNQNLTLRATKSNKLGQFLFARPLENGLYQILAEKENYKFETYSIDLTGEIINPLKIQATK